MNCKKARKWMSREFDDALSDRRIERLNEHLSACADCRAVREQWLKLRSAWRGRPPVEAPPAEALWADVRRAIRHSSAADAPPSWSWRESLGVRQALVAVAAVAVLLGAAMIHLMRRPPADFAAALSTAAVVEYVETELPGAAPMVYQDAETGWTVIWVVEANQKENGHAG